MVANMDVTPAKRALAALDKPASDAAVMHYTSPVSISTLKIWN
jgi:hypothetical protein